MFDYVSKADFKAEYTLRIQAEAREQVLREQNAELTRQLSEAQAAYRELVTRLHPDPVATAAAARVSRFDGTLRPERLSAAEILKIPATGGRELAARQRAYTEALEREEQEGAESVREARRKDLSPDEERELEAALSADGGR